MDNSKTIQQVLYALMRITLPQVFMMIAFTTLVAAAPTRGQEILTRKVSLDVHDKDIKAVLSEIEKQTSVVFTYRSKLIKSSRKISLKVSEAPLADVLKELFDPGIRVLALDDEEEIVLRPGTDEGSTHAVAPYELRISGNIVDEKGEALPGVSILEKGTSNGTTSDGSGNFALNVLDQNSILTFSFIGYTTQEVPVGNKTELAVSLQPDITSLEEVVVIGYGVQKKADITGALTSISPKEFAGQPVTRLDQILQGRASGVQVSNVGGAPGGDVRIRVRGANSILGDNNPLYVVDGYIGADFTTINPSDIATIQVLKDASSTAIYGSRGANGVIIITTKNGGKGGIHVNFSSQFSTSNRIKKLNTLSAGDYAQTINERAAATGGNPFFTQQQVDNFRVSGGTDWQDQVFTEAAGQEYQLGVSGGGDKTTFAVSGNFLDQDGIIRNSNFKRFALRSNIHSQITEKLSLRLNVSGTRKNNLNNGITAGTANPLVQALAWAPTTPPYDENGNMTLRDPTGSIFTNPLALMYDREYRTEIMIANMVGGLRYEFIPGLSLDLQYAVNYLNQQDKFNNGSIVTNNNPNAGRISSEQITLQSTNAINYSKTFADVHRIDAVAVFETQEFTNNKFNATGNTLLIPSLGYDNIGLAGSYQIGSEFSKWTLLSLMGRVNYSFKDKYLLSATVRRDGSSKFRGDNQYSVFPSVAAGWRISEESFMKDQDVVSNLKLRASWGLTGSQAIGPYATQSTYTTTQAAFTNNSARSGIMLGNPGNPNLKWETTEQTDIGLEAEFLQGKFLIEADYFVKNTEDLLLNRQLPGYVGGGNIAENVGVIQNKGWELAITVPVFTGDFGWTTSFNISNVKNMVKSVGGIADKFFTSSNVGAGMSTQAEFVYAPGQALGAYWGLVYEGTWKPDEADQAALRGEMPGDSRYQDLDGDNAITAADYQIIGSAIPTTTSGWNNTFTYKGFSLNVFFLGMFGMDKLNYTRAAALTGGADARQPILDDILDRYIPGVNETSNIPAFSTTNRNYTQSTRFMEKGDFIRLKNVSLGYDFPKRMVKDFGVRLFVSGTNLLTFTDYNGIDPESASSGAGTNQGGDTAQGIDYGSYPNSKTYTVGVNLTF
ncbi:MAG TPA: TonB-dependent receptor [Chryseolinea sp.]|nr:TonB-dependent receptor [Chryseolinea sp.]